MHESESYGETFRTHANDSRVRTVRKYIYAMSYKSMCCICGSLTAIHMRR